MQMLVRCGWEDWEVLDTLGAVRFEILLVSSTGTHTGSLDTHCDNPNTHPPSHIPTTKARMRAATLNPPMLMPPLLPTMIYYLIPYWCCCPPERVLVVIYYLILLPPLYWGHNATFTVENATYGPTAGKIGNIDHHRREIHLFLKHGKNFQIHIAHPGSINCGNWCKLCVACGVLRHIAVTRTMGMGNRHGGNGHALLCHARMGQMNASDLAIPHAPASGGSANE